MSKNEIKLKKCECVNEFQDQRYGPGIRVMNPRPNPTESERYRCTVCGRGYPPDVGGGPATMRRRARLECIAKMGWPEFIRKAGKR